MADSPESVPPDEDVLAENGPASGEKPGSRVPRNPFRRRRDYLIAGLIVVLSVATSVLVWQTSDLRATESRGAPAGAPIPDPPSGVPPSLAEAWRAPSAATYEPVTAGPSVVTGQGGTVAGRDPITGKVRWSYTRDRPLCTVASAWSRAVSVYRKDGLRDDPRCSEVTALSADTGQRKLQRTGDTELGTRLITDGSYVTATGRRLLNTWRDDLVLSVEYGTVPAPVNADKQPRTGCEFGSVTMAAGRVGVLERCPNDPGDRLSVYKATADDNDEPDEIFSVVVDQRGAAQLVALTSERAAVAIPAERALVVFDEKGERVASYPIDPSDPGIAKRPPGGVAPTSEDATGIQWFTGSRTISLSTPDLRPQWTYDGTLGRGTPFAGRVLLPVPDGLAVVDPTSGARIGTLPVNRRGYSGQVRTSSIGDLVLEQRGDTLVALH
ncbi:MAG: PQQ-binding-like beta-propeller repeat protein [Pseudonocardiaceae bacterium]|nr:PQQ-binding-like beta-propeller repeat protein [Pseudonocardiaceae bacterium]